MNLLPIRSSVIALTSQKNRQLIQLFKGLKPVQTMTKYDRNFCDVYRQNCPTFLILTIDITKKVY